MDRGIELFEGICSGDTCEGVGGLFFEVDVQFVWGAFGEDSLDEYWGHCAMENTGEVCIMPCVLLHALSGVVSLRAELARVLKETVNAYVSE